ncbi:flagellar biosynthesis anti-sigma factor FlgM [uncultured Ferrimonas sp.]|uniref:flagellar biosynthesis anti-sigma factor FlgM n=1 Tax=uncultured Ferrimonas sp. TaxID=432640 RepID=UPI002631F89C|nr:flagellar biosynthesis anti-sigma factor FlgM [uncultured Ferrimonas sp.]
MKIPAHDTQVTMPNRTSHATKQAPHTAAPQQTAPEQTQGSAISNDFMQLEQAATELSQLPEVNLDKVAALRQALESGNFELDLDAISEGLLEQHGQQR